jgi:hypothetical protein
MQIPALISASLDRGQAGMVGEGKNLWPNVEIHERAYPHSPAFNRNMWILRVFQLRTYTPRSTTKLWGTPRPATGEMDSILARVESTRCTMSARRSVRPLLRWGRARVRSRRPSRKRSSTNTLGCGGISLSQGFF